MGFDISETAYYTVFPSCLPVVSEGGRRGMREKGERIEIRGFGSFVMRQYGGYKGRNPKTGEIVDVAPKRLPYFKVGKELKELVNRQGIE